MCEVCEDIKVNVREINVNTYDPTRTTVLRNRMVAESNRYFETIAKDVRKAIVDEDVFGLQGVQVLQTPGKKAYAFLSDEKKIQEFLDWLEDLINRQLIEIWDVPYGNRRNWMYKYLLDAYQRGVSRARMELIRRGYDVPTIVESGGLTVIMQTPIHLDTVALLYTRSFNDLKGITSQMQQQIARVLTEGIMSGENPRKLARKLVATINGSGMGDLGLTDTLGRFIPAKRRAEILARTEVIRAHHMANINEYKTWGAYDVTVKAEFATAGDDRVCPTCEGLDGNIYTLDEATGLIPVHPQCRCIVLPIVKPKE